MDLWDLAVTDLLRAYRAMDATPIDAARACLKRIAGVDAAIGAFTDVFPSRAEAEAEQATQEIARHGVSKPLHGIPIAIKEIFDIGGSQTTYGSRTLRGRRPRADAAAVVKLRRAGAIILGFTRSHEFAWGITTQHEVLGGTRNPWSLSHIPGGSSGGSAAAVAARMVPAALGSDTGGSIRIPASFCGITGFKPTFGTVSLAGACPLAPSLDHAGPLARSVEDSATVLNALSEIDAPRWTDSLDGTVVATCPDLHLVDLEASHQRSFENSVEALRSIGCLVERRSFHLASLLPPTFSVIQRFEGFGTHTRVLNTYPEHASLYTPSVLRNLEAAESVNAGMYQRALEQRKRLGTSFEKLLSGARVLVTPVTAGPPSTVERPDIVDLGGREIPLRDMVMPFTIPQDLLGLPAISIMAGRNEEGLPIGIQLTGRRGDDPAVLKIAQVLQSTLGPQPGPVLTSTNRTVGRWATR